MTTNSGSTYHELVEGIQLSMFSMGCNQRSSVQYKLYGLGGVNFEVYNLSS